MPENIETRVEILEKIENQRKSKILSCFLGDRPGVGSAIAEDAVLPMYEHLREMGHVKQLDLFLYARGGSLEVPWRVVTMLREFCDKLAVIIPYKAYSAATLIALGADSILMSKKGELGPIDPSLQLRVTPGAKPPDLPSEIGVEDIYAYIRFVRDATGLTDQDALARQVEILSKKITPVVLGKIQRAYSHIRLIARKLLSLQQPPLEEPKIAGIIDALTEKIYIHGHGIGRKEAKEIGLTIKQPTEDLEGDIWSLYKNYENTLGLGTTHDLSWYLRDHDDQPYVEENTDIAYIESVEMSHAFRGTLEIKNIRKIPPNPQINLNLSLQMPAGVQPEALPQNIQQLITQMLQQSAPRIMEIVRREIARQSPIIRVEPRIRYGAWLKIR